MGIFSFLKNLQLTYSDKVWNEGDFAIKGMLTDALQSITKNEMAVVLTFFDDTKLQVRDFLVAKQVPYFDLDSANLSEAASQSQVVFLLDANLLNTSIHVLSFLLSQSRKQKISILVFRHYPIPSKENKILEKLATIDSEIVFYSSLDDPAFKMFGGESLKSTLEKLGLVGEETIQHAMVTRAMKNAREKIEQGVREEIICPTETDWFNKNYSNKKS